MCGYGIPLANISHRCDWLKILSILGTCADWLLQKSNQIESGVSCWKYKNLHCCWNLFRFWFRSTPSIHSIPMDIGHFNCPQYVNFETLENEMRGMFILIIMWVNTIPPWKQYAYKYNVIRRCWIFCSFTAWLIKEFPKQECFCGYI